MAQYELTQQIISRSVAKIWDEAKLEWILENIYEADEPETCLCGHFPIIEICILRNKQNHNQVIVGNCCVKKFIGLPSDKIFQAVKRVRNKGERALNAEAVSLAYEHGWINDWERDFYFNTIKKRKLSANQTATRLKINERILKYISSPAVRRAI